MDVVKKSKEGKGQKDRSGGGAEETHVGKGGRTEVEVVQRRRRWEVLS